MRADLHTHSARSDGTDAPAQVMADAVAAGLDVVALTDHDTVTGWDEARAAAAELGLGLVPGMEISCRWEGVSVHLLAYLPDPTDAALLGAVQEARDSRLGRAARMVDLLAADGYPITREAVQAEVGEGAAIGRPHIADALVGAGVYATRAEAFDGVLARTSPYYVQYQAVDPVRAVELVLGAGGVPVMAHPFASRRGEVAPNRVIEDMADAGLAGLEAHHRDHTPAQVAHAEATAQRLGLLVTGSSDYHGDGKPNRLGENTTDPAVVRAVVERGTGAEALAPAAGWGA